MHIGQLLLLQRHVWRSDSSWCCELCLVKAGPGWAGRFCGQRKSKEWTVAHTRGIRPEVVGYLVAKGATGTMTTWARD